jgi:uncharacterized alpha-E superfamily protein
MNNLRPDEKASLKQVQNSKENLGLLKKGIGLATAATGFAGANRILPFLDKLVPSSLAIQGLKKVDKRIGTFIDRTLENGFSADNVLGFLRDQFNPSQTNQSNQQTQQANPLQEFETNYPDIAQALQGYIQQGQSPDAAAAILKSSTPFGKKIQDLEKSVGKNFIDYVLELFGNPQQQISQQPQQAAPQAQQQMQQPHQAQQPGGINPQLQQIMNGIRTAMQNLSGTP